MAKHQRIELTEQTMERITRVVRGLADDRVERGVDLSRPMHCDSCDQDKNPAGSALYGAYQFCNDCLLDFTVNLATGVVDNAAEFMTRRTDGTPPPDLSAERHTLGSTPLSARDKLVPRNEPC